MADPFRERRLVGAEVRHVLRRAAELAENDPETAATERSLTREEFERTAAELGLPPGAVAAAFEGAEAEERRAEGGWFLGAPTRFAFEDEFDGEPSESDREDLIEDLRTFFGETGSVETLGKTLIWRLGSGHGGRGRDLTVRVRARKGKTRIAVVERLVRPAAGLFVGLGVGGGIGPMGAYIAAIMTLGGIGLVFPVLWIPLMLLLARTIFTALARRRERELHELMAVVKKSVAAWSTAGEQARLRVESPESEAETEAEAEAAAEEEVAEGSGAGERSRSR